MREHVHIASRRRDERLALIRKLTLWITGGAAATSLGLGAAFAHAVPGRAASTAGTSGSGSATSSAPAQPGSGASTSPASDSAGNSSPQTQFVQPQQQPTHSTAPPVVTSGGS
jgi:hypothetical protein